MIVIGGQMKNKKFLIYTKIGSIPWTLLFVLSGYYLGSNYTKIANIVDIFKIPIIIFITLLFLIYIYMKLLKPKIVVMRIKDKK